MFERIILVSKPTALEELLRRQSEGQVAFFLKSRGTSIEEYQAEDAAYRAALDAVRSSLPDETPLVELPRERIAGFLFRESDLIVITGPDGLFVNVAKYLDGQPVITVNPDPTRIDGVLMRFAPEEVMDVVKRVARGSARTDQITLAKAQTNDGQTLYAVNDFLIGRRDQISARYTLSLEDRTERQSSSGILVATGVGASGWLKSILSTAEALVGNSTRVEIPEWEDEFLCFVVREAFPSRYTGTSLLFGEIYCDEGAELIVTSEMSEGGTIFSDGVPEDAIEFDAGCIATISVAEKTAQLVAK